MHICTRSALGPYTTVGPSPSLYLDRALAYPGSILPPHITLLPFFLHDPAGYLLMHLPIFLTSSKTVRETVSNQEFIVNFLQATGHTRAPNPGPQAPGIHCMRMRVIGVGAYYCRAYCVLMRNNVRTRADELSTGRSDRGVTVTVLAQPLAVSGTTGRDSSVSIVYTIGTSSTHQHLIKGADIIVQ